MFNSLKTIIKPKNILFRKIVEKNIKLNEKQVFEKNEMNVNFFKYLDMYFVAGGLLGAGTGATITFNKIETENNKHNKHDYTFNKFFELYFGTTLGLMFGGVCGVICCVTVPITMPVFTVLAGYNKYIKNVKNKLIPFIINI